jgi:hypothetical protein
MKTFFASAGLAYCDIAGLKMYEHQPEAWIFAGLALIAVAVMIAAARKEVQP